MKHPERPTRYGRFQILSLTTALVAVLAYCAADSRPGLGLLAVVAALASAWLISPNRSAASRQTMPVSLPGWLINTLVVAASVHVFVQFGTSRQAPVTFLADFLVHILLVKMLNRGRIRDEAQMLGLSVFVIIGAVLSSNGLPLGFALLVYTPMAVTCAVLLQLHGGFQRQRDLVGAVQPTGWTLQPTLTGRSRHQLLIITATGIIAAAVLGVGTFLLTPRTLTQQLFGGFGNVRLGAMTDFHDQIKLGEAGLIQTSEETVMDVAIFDARGEPMTPESGFVGPIYLRGAVLEVYDRATGLWRPRSADPLSRLDRRAEWSKESLQAETLTSMGEALSTTAAAAAIEQRITLRSIRPEQAALFGLWRPFAIRFDQSGNLTRNLREQTLQFQPTTRGNRLSYTLISSPDLGEPAPSAARRSQPNAETRPDIDTTFASGPTHDLARETLQRASVAFDPGERDAGANRRAVQAIIAELRARCGYTLEMVAPREGQDAIDMFLFDTKRGHCEYFAAAAVAMCRAAGLPARIVTGYAGGEFNTISAQYVIRRADAHAWIEVQLRPGRWETFDPTPPTELGPARRADSGRGLLARLRQLYEAIEFTWVGSVVAFDRSATDRVDLASMAQRNRQRMTAFKDAIDHAITRVRSLVPGLGGFGATAATAAVVLAALAFASFLGRALWHWLVNRFHSRRAATPVLLGPDGRPVRFYERTLKALALAGLAKPEGTPPLQHARELARRDDAPLPPRAIALFESLTRVYYGLRFGRSQIDPAQLAQVNADARELQSLLTTRHRAPRTPGQHDDHRTER